MIKLNNDEKDLVKRAIVATKHDLEHLDLSPENTEHLLLIINTYRSRAYIMPRGMDNGKEFDTWVSLRNRLGQPAKSRSELMERSLRAETESIQEKKTERYEVGISNLEKKLKLMQEKKKTEEHRMESDIQFQLNMLEEHKADQEMRLKVAKDARKKIELKRKMEKVELDKKAPTGKQVKCFSCGDWFAEGIGFRNHEKACKAKHESDNE